MRYSRALVPVILVFLINATPVLASEFDRAVELHQSGHASKAVSILSKLAKDGDVDAQAYLGAMYGSGNGVPQDLQLALKWQRAAASKGHVLAQYNTAVLLARGDKNSRNLEEAFWTLVDKAKN